MKKNKFPVNKIALLSLFFAVSSLVRAAANDPLVLVIHGIGGGNREDGWSNKIADRWMVPVKEITFRQEGREDTSFTDFARNADDWALDVQRQIKQAAAANPGRRLIIVSHSWGTVATKLALAGGSTHTGEVPAIDLSGLQVEELITLGSPLGRAETPEVALNLRQLGVVLNEGRPPVVKHWTNIYDEADPVSNQSHALSGAENIGVTGSGHWYDPTGLSAHSGIWTNQRVARAVQQKFDAIGDMLPLPTRQGSGKIMTTNTASRPSAAGNSEEQVVAEYRSLLPAVLQAGRKPWHTRFNILANAVKEGSGYRVNYQTFCLIDQGPDKGKDYVCFEYETVLDFEAVKSAVADMKRQLGR